MRRSIIAGAIALGAAIVAPAQAAVVLADGHGRVEVVPQGGGRGQGILPGEPLGAGTLAVGSRSHATLKTDDGATLDLDGSSKASVSAGEATKVALTKGKLVASGGKKPVQVEAGGGLVASATGSKFEVALDGDGAVTVVSDQGAVQLALNGAKSELGSGKSISLAQGDALPASAADAKPAEKPAAKPVEVAAVEKPAAKPVEVAQAEKPAEKPAAKPGEVAEAEKPAEKPAEAPAPAEPPKLAVKWPSGTVGLSYTFKGTVTPGAQVTVNDVAAQVKKNGSFSAKLTLSEGVSTVAVKATGADGQVTSTDHSVTAAAPVAKPDDSDDSPKPEKNTKPQVKQEASGWE